MFTAQIPFHAANAQCKKLFRSLPPPPKILSFKMDIHLWIANRIKISRRHKVIQWLFAQTDVWICVCDVQVASQLAYYVFRECHWQSEKYISPSGLSSMCVCVCKCHTIRVSFCTWMSCSHTLHLSIKFVFCVDWRQNGIWSSSIGKWMRATSSNEYDNEYGYE